MSPEELAQGAIDNRAAQKYTELRDFIRSLGFRQFQPRRVIEIGTMSGGTLWLWGQLATEDATILSIDLPGGEWGGGYAENSIPKIKGLMKSSQKLHLIRADSHNAETIRMVGEVFDPHSIDLLFIDGDHSEWGCKTDWNNYVPFVRSGGLVVFHDILEHTNKNFRVSEVWNLLEELDYGKRWTCCAPDELHPQWGVWGGIGVIEV